MRAQTVVLTPSAQCLGRGLSMCVSNKSPCDADTAGLGTAAQGVWS